MTACSSISTFHGTKKDTIDISSLILSIAVSSQGQRGDHAQLFE